MAAAEQGHIGGPPVPRPLLTSLAAIPGAGEEGCVTNNECDLLRRDAQVCGAMLAAVLAGGDYPGGRIDGGDDPLPPSVDRVHLTGPSTRARRAEGAVGAGGCVCVSGGGGAPAGGVRAARSCHDFPSAWRGGPAIGTQNENEQTQTNSMAPKQNKHAGKSGTSSDGSGGGGGGGGGGGTQGKVIR